MALSICLYLRGGLMSGGGGMNSSGKLSKHIKRRRKKGDHFTLTQVLSWWHMQIVIYSLHKKVTGIMSWAVDTTRGMFSDVVVHLVAQSFDTWTPAAFLAGEIVRWHRDAHAQTHTDLNIISSRPFTLCHRPHGVIWVLTWEVSESLTLCQTDVTRLRTTWVGNGEWKSFVGPFHETRVSLPSVYHS